MKSRIRQIIELLLKEHRPITSQELSVLLELSEKTIREEISDFWNTQTDESVMVLSTHKGYRVKVNIAHDLLNEYLEELDNRYGTAMIERQLLIRLLLADAYIKLEDVAAELYVSAPTVYRALKEIKKTLQRYDLRVQAKPAYGVRLSGSEKDKRLCFAHCYTDHLRFNVNELLVQCAFTNEEYLLLNYIVQKSLSLYHFTLTEMGLRNLTVHLAFAISRIKKGNYIEKVPDAFKVTRQEHQIAALIIRRIEEEFHVTFPKTEAGYIEIHLLCKRANTGNEEYFISAQTEELLTEIHREIKRALGYDFLNDMELFTMLAIHLEAMLSRIAIGTRMPNPVLEEIKTQFVEAYECAVAAAKVVYQKYGFQVSDHELGYLALHYNLAIERFLSKRQCIVLAVCSSGMGTAKFLEKKISLQYHIPKENVKHASLQELPHMDLDSVDFIVSTVKIPYHLNKKIIYLDNVLSDIAVESADVFDYTSILPKELFFLEQPLMNQQEVLDFLCAQVMAYYQLTEDFKSQVWQREQLSSTDIGNYVAIPHTLEMNDNEMIFAFCSLKKAIQWRRRKVKYVFLISHCKKDLEQNNRFNEALFSKLMNPGWILKLEKVKTYEALIELLEEPA